MNVKNWIKACREVFSSQLFWGVMIIGGGAILVCLLVDSHLITEAFAVAMLKLSILTGAIEAISGLRTWMKEDNKMLGVTDVKQIEMK